MTERESISQPWVYRDKTYVQLDNGMMFNVTGYRHPEGAVYANLKYVDGKKWKQGYDASLAFLRDVEPTLVTDYVQVPLRRIARIFEPQQRWQQLANARKSQSLLHAEALNLGRVLRELLEIPVSNAEEYDSEFGVTDSLLWGTGHSESDIDLLVVGRRNAARLSSNMNRVYAFPGFSRPDPLQMGAPYGMAIANWPQLLARKLHMGVYCDRLFSLRVMLDFDEAIMEQTKAIVSVAEEAEWIDFRVADVRDALLFPAIYRNAVGDVLLDYSVVYEGVFQIGDHVRCLCTRQTTETGSQRVTEYVLQKVDEQSLMDVLR